VGCICDSIGLIITCEIPCIRKINELLGLKKYAQKRDVNDLMLYTEDGFVTLETCYFGTYEKKRDVHKIKREMLC
jgi:hypothetical protein